MNVDEFTEYLFLLETDDVVEFGLDPGCAWPDEVPIPENVTNWYFAKKMYIHGYDSRFILVDYAGGDEAFAIPLGGFMDSDKSNALMYLNEYLNSRPCAIDGDLIVFVEMEDNA